LIPVDQSGRPACAIAEIKNGQPTCWSGSEASRKHRRDDQARHRRAYAAADLVAFPLIPSPDETIARRHFPQISNNIFGRGSWIRTNDLQYPKLPRYQAALYPDHLANEVDTRLTQRQQEAACRLSGR
jgi:hypothetical protein